MQIKKKVNFFFLFYKEASSFNVQLEKKLSLFFSF